VRRGRGGPGPRAGARGTGRDVAVDDAARARGRRGGARGDDVAGVRGARVPRAPAAHARRRARGGARAAPGPGRARPLTTVDVGPGCPPRAVRAGSPVRTPWGGR